MTDHKLGYINQTVQFYFNIWNKTRITKFSCYQFYRKYFDWRVNFLHNVRLYSLRLLVLGLAISQPPRPHYWGVWKSQWIAQLWDAKTHFTSRWRHNEHDGVSNHQPHDCLFKRLFRRISKKTSKLRVTGLCVRGIHRWPVNSPHKGPVTRKMFPFDDVIMYKSYWATYITLWSEQNIAFFYFKWF